MGMASLVLVSTKRRDILFLRGSEGCLLPNPSLSRGYVFNFSGDNLLIQSFGFDFLTALLISTWVFLPVHPFHEPIQGIRTWNTGMSVAKGHAPGL